MKTLNLSFETVGSIAAMFIGVCALFVTWDQAQIMRKQQHAAVLPVLTVDVSMSSAGDAHAFAVTLHNEGVGPAMVQSAAMTVEGQTIETWGDFAAAFLPTPLATPANASIGTSRGVIAAGEDETVLRLIWPQTPVHDAAFRMLTKRIFGPTGANSTFVVCYCSVFDRCWEIGGKSEQDQPQKVPRCVDQGRDVTERLLTTRALTTPG
ncbi:MAG: hypothetical protein AAF850_00680 [Pseudomonadota bacterium]